jgi:imidazolonepropionase-like amidohydrolase
MINRTAALLLAVVATLATAVPAGSQTQTLAITRVTVVDVADGRLMPNSTVTIAGGKITAVTANGRAPAGARIVDGQGKFLVPGLWDMHAHMEASGESALQLSVAHGVTGLRDMGSDLGLILKMRDATASGRVIGPRIFAAGPILDDAPGNWPFRMRVRSAADGRSAVRLLKRRGVDLIKVHDNTPRVVFFAIADEARRQSLPVAGHVPRGMTAEEVIGAGQRDIEHLSNGSLWKRCSGGEEYRPEACRPFFEMLARRGIWQTPTLAATAEIMTVGTPASEVKADRLAYASQSLRKMWAGNQGTFGTPELIRVLRAMTAVGATVTNDMAKAGVGVLAGCDSMVAGFCVGDELAVMVRGGMKPLAALQTATLNPARYFGLEQTLGTVATGRTADLVLLDANPLIDITHVQRVHAVVVAGRLLDRKELDTLLAQVKAAARLR